MNVTDITNKEYKNPSETLVSLMDQFSETELNRSELMQKILNQAKEEKIEPSLIRKMIVERLKAKGLSDRSITNAIPDELKDKKMQQVRSHRLEYVRKDTEDREVQSIPEIVEEQTVPVPQPVIYDDHPKIQSWDNTDVLAQMNELPNTPFITHNQPSDYTVNTKLVINNGDKGKYMTDVVINCYPITKTAEIAPIERSSIVKVNE